MKEIIKRFNGIYQTSKQWAFDGHCYHQFIEAVKQSGLNIIYEDRHSDLTIRIYLTKGTLIVGMIHGSSEHSFYLRSVV